MDIGTILMLSVLFSSIGAGYFIYGKKQQQCVPLLTGIALCVYPYFLSNGSAIVVVGILLTTIPWLIKIYDIFGMRRCGEPREHGHTPCMGVDQHLGNGR
jgi:hypothetical protein